MRLDENDMPVPDSPPVAVGGEAPTGRRPLHTVCPRCHHEYIEEEFCPHCGVIRDLPFLAIDRPPAAPHPEEAPAETGRAWLRIPEFEAAPEGTPAKTLLLVSVVIAIGVGGGLFFLWLKLGTGF